jgi:hypothetical protein
VVSLFIEPPVLVAQRGDGVCQLIDAFGALEQQDLQLSDMALFIAQFVPQLDDGGPELVDIALLPSRDRSEAALISALG